MHKVIVVFLFRVGVQGGAGGSRAGAGGAAYQNEGLPDKPEQQREGTERDFTAKGHHQLTRKTGKTLSYEP